MNIAHEVTPTQLMLHEARKERAQKRNEAAGRRQIANPAPRVIMLLPDGPYPKRPEVDADAHVRDYRIWLAETKGHPVRNYIRRRAEELGVTYAEVVSGSRTKRIVGPKHQIIWEVKRNLRPAISYPELAKLFGLTDHTTSRYVVLKMDRVMGWVDGN